MYRRIESLRPEAQEICRQGLEKIRSEHGIDCRITETFRSTERQEALQKSGASDKKLGWHNVGLAWDFACFDEHGKLITRGDDPRYAKCGTVWAGLGCKYPIHLANGSIDADHAEYHPGFTLQQYLANVAQGSVKAWNPPEET